MKTLKTNSFKLVTLLCMVSLTYSCSNDDDASGSATPTTLELLTSNTWYFESKSQGNYSECQKESSFDFMPDGSIAVNFVDDLLEVCVYYGTINTTYTLDGLNIDIDLDQDSIIGIMAYDPSLETLTIINDDGDFIVFDKIEG